MLVGNGAEVFFIALAAGFDGTLAHRGVVLAPATGEERAAAAPPALVQTLMERQVEPISVGRTLVATWQRDRARRAIPDRDGGAPGRQE